MVLNFKFKRLLQEILKRLMINRLMPIILLCIKFLYGHILLPYIILTKMSA